jgi:NADP-dependent 3-hydroxy acid dehydrogenase YdfG
MPRKARFGYRIKRSYQVGDRPLTVRRGCMSLHANRNAESVERLCEQIRAAGERNVISFDVTDASACEQAIEGAAAAPIQVLVNCAGMR